MDLDDIVARLRDGDRDARRAAARELWQATRASREIPGDLWDAVEPALEGIAPRIEPALTDDDPVVRGHVTAVFGDVLFRTHKNDAPIPRLASLLERLTDDDERVRQTATGVLWNRRWWDKRSGFAEGITAAQRELWAVGLVECVQDPVALTRRRASHELQPSLVVGHPHPEKATGPLVRALDDDQEGVRSNVAAVLTEVAPDHSDLLAPHLDRLHRMNNDAAREVLATLDE